MCVFRLYQREVSISSYTVLLIFDPCLRWQLCVEHEKSCSSVELYRSWHCVRRHTMKIHHRLRYQTHCRLKHKIHRRLKQKKSLSSRELCTAWHTVRRHAMYYFVTLTI